MRIVKSEPAALSLSLLGPFQITFNRKPIVGVTSDRVRGLLAFLAMESGRPHRRDRLAEMFWPDRSSGVGRNNLKQAIANLRKILGDRVSETPYLLVSRNEIQFNPKSSSSIDVNEFLALIDATQNHAHAFAAGCVQCAEWLNEAVETYQGDFLIDTSIPDSQAFEEWSIVQRETFRRQQARSLLQLSVCCESRGDLKSASRHARRLVDLEAWNEEHHRTLMRLYAAQGLRSKAMRQYQIYERIMKDEFGVEPAQETIALLEEITDWNSEFSVTSPAVSTPGKENILSSAGKVIAEQRSTIFRIPHLPGWVLPLAVSVLVGTLALVLLGRSSIEQTPDMARSASNNQPDRISANDDWYSSSVTRDVIPFSVGSGAHWYVSTLGDDDKDCRSPGTACASLNGVLWKHNFADGDTIYVASGTYKGYGSEVVLIHQNAALSGGWNSDFTAQDDMAIVDGDGRRRGLTISQEATVVVERFGFTNGSSTNGGGILVGGILAITQSAVNSNMAVREGGGIHIQSEALLFLDKSTVSHNEATSGGGIFNGWGTLYVSNSTISGNEANGGGGINNLGGVVNINNSTVSDNHMSTMGGGGIRNEDGGKVILKNTILTENHGYGPDCNGIIESSGYNLIGDTSECSFIGSPGDLIDLKPHIGVLGDNGGITFTHGLLPESPAIDSGAPPSSSDDESRCEPVDQRGVIRPQDGDSSNGRRCDIGAVELEPSS